MKAFKRGAVIGALCGAVAILAVAGLAFLGPEPAGGTGERIMGLYIMIALIGAPLSIAVATFVDAVGPDSPFFLLGYPFALLAVLADWSLIGGLVAWGLYRWRTGRTSSRVDPSA